jgi:hypothetical protein
LLQFETLHEQVDGSVIDNALFMARHEMDEILHLDEVAESSDE